MLFSKVVRPCILALGVSLVAFSSHAQDYAEHFEKALKAFEAQDYPTAIIHLKNSLAKAPKYTPSRLLLGKIYLYQEDFLDAENALSVALSENADVKVILPLLVESKIQLNKTQEGIALLEQYGVHDNPELMTLRARLAVQEENLPAAKALVERALMIKPGLVAAKLVLADVANRQLRYSDAIELTNEILATEPSDIQARLIKARSLEAQEQLQQAYEQYSIILTQAPDNTIGLFGAALLLKKMGRADDALAASISLREKLPENPFAKLLYAVISGSQDINNKEVERALKDISTQLSSIDLDKIPPSQVYLLSGYVNYLTKRYAEANRNFYKYKVADGSDIVVYKLIADTEVKLGNLDNAYDYYRQYLSRRPDDETETANMLSVAKARLPLASYQVALRDALKRFPHNLSFRNHLAATYIADGNIEKAHALLSADYRSDEYLLDLQLARLLIRIQAFSEAAKVTSALLSKQPLNPEGHKLAGDLSLVVGDRDKALMFFKQAIQLQPHFVPALMSLASLALNDKNYPDAERYLKSIEQDTDAVKLLKASLAIERRAYGEAKGLLEAVYENEPTLATAKSLIEVYSRVGAFGGAQSLLDTWLPKNRLDEDLLMLSINLDRQLGKPVSNSQLHTLYAMFYDKPPKLLALFEMAMWSEDVALTEKIYQRCEALAMPNTQLLYLATQLAMLKQDYDKAWKLFTQLESEAANVTSVAELGFNLANVSNKADEAETRIKSLFEKTRSKKHFKSYVGVLLNEKKWPQAIELMQSWIGQFPQDLSAIYLLASTFKSAGQVNNSIRVLEDSLAFSENPVTFHKLAYLLQNTDPKKARIMADKALALSPKNPAFNDTVGWFYYQDGDYHKALEYLRTAQTFHANEPSLNYHLAATLHQLGRSKEAYTLVQKAMLSSAVFTERAEARALMLTLKTIVNE